MHNNNLIKIKTLLFLIIIQTSWTFAQTSIEISLSKPMPTVTNTFSEYWDGDIGFGAGVQKNVGTFKVGTSFQYDHLSMNSGASKAFDESNLEILSLFVNCSKDFKLSEKSLVIPTLGVGYSLLLYSNEKLPNEYSIENENAFAINPSIKIKYNIAANLKLFGLVYNKIILEKYGNDALEDSYIMSVFSFGIGVSYEK